MSFALESKSLCKTHFLTKGNSKHNLSLHFLRFIREENQIS